LELKENEEMIESRLKFENYIGRNGNKNNNKNVNNVSFKTV